MKPVCCGAGSLFGFPSRREGGRGGGDKQSPEASHPVILTELCGKKKHTHTGDELLAQLPVVTVPAGAAAAAAAAHDLTSSVCFHWNQGVGSTTTTTTTTICCQGLFLKNKTKMAGETPATLGSKHVSKKKHRRGGEGVKTYCHAGC